MSYEKPNYTQIPNTLLDEHMKDMGESELKVVLAISRKTFGWQKDSDKISISQLEELTGLSRQGVIDGVNSAIERSVIEREVDGQGYIYKIVVSKQTSQQSRLVNNVDQSTSQQSRPELVNSVDQFDEKLVNKVDTQKKVFKEKERKHSADKPQQKSTRKKNSGEQSNPVVKEILAAYVEVRGKNGINYGKEGAWAKKIANEQPENGDAVVLVKGCYQWLKAQDFWKFKPVGMATIYEYMEEYKRYTQHSKAQQAKQQPKKVVIINQFTGQTEEKIIQ